MCLKGVELERREDGQPQLIHRRGQTNDNGSYAESITEGRNLETVIIPISPEDLYGRHRWMPDGPPVIIGISPLGSPRHQRTEAIGCGVTFVVVEDGHVKQRSCRHSHRCLKCKDKPARREHQTRRDDDTDSRKRKRHKSADKTSLHDIIGKISDLLGVYGEKDEEMRRLRGELQKVKMEEKNEDRKLDRIEKVLQNVAASPLLSSPLPDGPHHGHSRFHQHSNDCQCHRCHPPRAPPSTPSVWQGPYGCEPPRFSIPAGKRTQKHHKNRERKHHKRHAPWHTFDSSLTNSTISASSGSSRSSRASQIAKESFDKVRSYAIRQSRKLKVLDAKIDSVKAQMESVDAKANDAGEKGKTVDARLVDVTTQVAGHDERLKSAEACLKDSGKNLQSLSNRTVQNETELRKLHDQTQSLTAETHRTENGLRVVEKKAHGLGLHLEHNLARTEVLGVQTRQVEARADMAQQSAQRLDTQVGALTVQGQVQGNVLSGLDERLVIAEGSIGRLWNRRRREDGRNDERWRESAEREVIRNYVPISYERNQGGRRSDNQPVDVDIERIERVHATRDGSREGRRAQRAPQSGNDGGFAGRTVSHVRRRVG